MRIRVRFSFFGSEDDDRVGKAHFWASLTVRSLLPLRSRQESLLDSLFLLLLIRPPCALSWAAKPPFPPGSLTASRKKTVSRVVERAPLAFASSERAARVLCAAGRDRPEEKDSDWSAGGQIGARISFSEERSVVLGSESESDGNG